MLSASHKKYSMTLLEDLFPLLEQWETARLTEAEKADVKRCLGCIAGLTYRPIKDVIVERSEAEDDDGERLTAFLVTGEDKDIHGVAIDVWKEGMTMRVPAEIRMNAVQKR